MGSLGFEGFSFEELEDEELLDFFLSTGGSFSDSSELSGVFGLIGSVIGGFAGSSLGPKLLSLGSDFLDDELDEDFLILGESISTTLGLSGFLISSLSELESSTLVGSTTGFSLLDELLDELLCFFFLSFFSFFFLLELEELELDEELLCFFLSFLEGFSGIVGTTTTSFLSDFSLPELTSSSLTGSTGFTGSLGGKIGSSFESPFLLDELLEESLTLGDSTRLSSIGTFGDSGFSCFSLSELESEDFLGTMGSAGVFWDELDSDLGFGGSSEDFFFDELEEDEELLDFFLSTGGRISDSLGVSGLSGNTGDLVPDFLLEELDEDFMLLGFSSFLSSSAGFVGSFGFSGEMILKELDDDELLDFLLSVGFSGITGAGKGLSLFELELDELDSFKT